jgi:hypothetical protein
MVDISAVRIRCIGEGHSHVDDGSSSDEDWECYMKDTITVFGKCKYKVLHLWSNGLHGFENVNSRVRSIDMCVKLGPKVSMHLLTHSSLCHVCTFFQVIAR